MNTLIAAEKAGIPITDAEAVELNECADDDPFAGLLTPDEEAAQRRSNEAYRDALARRPSNRRHGVQEAA